MSVDLFVITLAGAFAGVVAFGIVEAAAYLEGGDTLVAETVAKQVREPTR